MGLEKYSDRDLLALYAPVLRFAGGEAFLPMNVEDFVGGDTRLLRTENGKEQRVPEWEATPDPRDRLRLLGKFSGEEFHLQYLVQSASDQILRGLLTLEVFLLVAAAIFSLFRLASLYPSIHFDTADALKLSVLGLLIVIWPFVDADGKTHLALLLNLFGILFFGTAFAIGFAVLALGQLAGFWVVFFVFRLGFQRFVRRSRRWSVPALHGISLFLITLSNVLIGYGADWMGRPRGWITGSRYELPIILTASTLLFYFLAAFSEALRQRNFSEGENPQEPAYIVVTLFALIVAGGIFYLGLHLGMLSAPAIYLGVIFLAGAILLWYLLDPLSITRPGLLREDNNRRSVFGWDGRVLFIITVTLLVYLGASALVYFHSYADINDILIATLVHFFVSALIVLISLGILGDGVPGYVLDVLSGLYNTDAFQARKKYREAVARRLSTNDAAAARRYWYYGCVAREGEWIILQYNYFYAFNDFRSTAGGMNNHEGDWECVNVFLHDDERAVPCTCTGTPHILPFGVAYSQHYHGMFEFWEEAAKAKDGHKQETCHALIYAGLGSHANFSHPEIYPISAQFSGATQRLVTLLEKLIQAFRTRSRLVEKQIREVERAFNYYEGKNKSDLIAQGDQSEIGSREYAGGDGIRIGYGFKPEWKVYGDELKIALAPPPAVRRRESNFDGMPASQEDIFDDWAFEVITDDTDWVKYKGLWGRKSRVEGESGPQGPRWAAGDQIRERWGGGTPGYFLEWLDILLLDIVQDDTKPTKLRKKAFQHLSDARSEEAARTAPG